jgi:hypothetical protein
VRFNLSVVSPRVKPVGSSKVRTDLRDDRTPHHWEFDAVPRVILHDVRRGGLSRIDPDVLGVILRFRGPRRDSVWITKKKIAAELGVSPRTIQSSIKRLIQFRWIDHWPVGPVDPDDPRNRTGWRFFFLWVLEDGLRSLGDLPAERLPAWAKARMGYSTKDLVNSFPAKVCGTAPGGGGAHFFSPPPKAGNCRRHRAKTARGGEKKCHPNSERT